MRHGETTWNAGGILQGQASSSLSDVGKDQARAVADRLGTQYSAIAAIYSSDLERALDTANTIASKCHISQVKIMKELRERHLGKLQGLSRQDARLQEPEAFKILVCQRGDEPLPGGGESLDEFCERCRSSFQKIAEKHLGEQVVVVTHGGVMNALHRHVKGKPSPGRILNTSINVFKVTNEKVWSLHSWGDVSHLTGQIQATSFADPDSA